jgi:COMPASS component SWD3
MASDEVSNGPSAPPRTREEEASTKAPIAYTPYTLEATLTGHQSAVSAVKFSPDGRILASSSADGTIRLYSAADSSYPLIAELVSPTGPGVGFSDLSFSDGSRMIAAASDDRTVRIWDLESQTQIKSLNGHTNYVFCCSFNPQSNMLASGSFDETVRVWEVNLGLLAALISIRD